LPYMVWYGKYRTGFPMHLDLYVVHCAAPIEFSIEPPYPLSSGAMYGLPAEEQWYPAVAPF
jgi:hypothetical protein